MLTEHKGVSVVFTESEEPTAVEWAGTSIGLTNTITRTKSRTAVHDKTVDRTPGLLESLLASVQRHRKAFDGREPFYSHDVIIHGIRARAETNSAHLYQFWVENWYSPEEWQSITGETPPAEPQAMVYAFGGVDDQKEAAYYSNKHNTIAFFNTSYYGQLKSWVLGAVGRILAAEYGIHSLHSACVVKGGNGVLYIAPTGTGKSTSSYGLMNYPESRFHSDDWVYTRYTHALRSGQRFLVTRIRDGETVVRGYQTLRWLEENQGRRSARVEGIGLDNKPVECSVGDLDLSEPLKAYAYTSEKVFYLRCNLVENFPLSAYQILHSHLENCPKVTPLFWEEHGPVIHEITDQVVHANDGRLRTYFGSMPRQELEEKMARMFAFDNARAMLDIGKVLAPERVFTNPLEPAPLSAVFLIMRNFDTDLVVRSLSQGMFISRLMVGETPARTYETAYNAYRAVDDKEERSFINELIEQAGAGQVATERLYELYRARADKPETLLQEFELFRAMHRSMRCYDLNTILQKDSSIRTKQEAVGRSIDLIAKTVELTPESLELNLQNYAQFIASG